MKFASLKMSRERFDVTSRSETTHLTRVSRLAPDDDFKKINSVKRVSPETLFDSHVSHKTDVLMMMDTCVSERENEVCFIEDAYR